MVKTNKEVVRFCKVNLKTQGDSVLKAAVELV
jgi:hypothetical protein